MGIMELDEAGTIFYISLFGGKKRNIGSENACFWGAIQ